MNTCHVCEKQENKFIEVLHFHERNLLVCSSWCLLVFAQQDFLKWSGNQLSEAREAIRDMTSALRATLASEPHSFKVMEEYLKRLKTALYLVDHQK